MNISHDRKSIKLKNYDYSRVGSYFVTICIKNKECFFGHIESDKILLSEIGKIAEQFWVDIPCHFKNVCLDEFILMPNHIHGIITIIDKNIVGVEHVVDVVGVEHVQPLQNKYQHIIKNSVGSIVRQYKSSVTRWCNHNGFSFFKWQRNYYEHIIRNEHELLNIQKYIRNNHLNWNIDQENPSNITVNSQNHRKNNIMY